MPDTLLAPVEVPLIKIVVLIGGLMTAAAYFVLLERWIAAWVQDRNGPNRVGIPLTKIKLFGLGQPLADGGSSSSRKSTRRRTSTSGCSCWRRFRFWPRRWRFSR